MKLLGYIAPLNRDWWALGKASCCEDECILGRSVVKIVELLVLVPDAKVMQDPSR